jgi:haloacid dehalogenase superfamily, subfamily IA, variant 1 with third motif having Dx(3-4)D or Dx(3-4)E
MKFKAVIFDLDGTLLDTIDDLADSMNAVLESSTFPIHGTDAYKYFVGDGVRNLVKRALPENYRDDETVNRHLVEMQKEYSKRWADKTKPYEGIPELLDGLVSSGIKITVLSNKVDEFTKLIVAKLLPDWSFEMVLGERKTVPKKPNPAGAFEIARQLGIPTNEFLYLGDTNVDMQTANSAGMYAVGALWGFRQAEELVEGGAHVLIPKPQTLLDLL